MARVTFALQLCISTAYKSSCIRAGEGVDHQIVIFISTYSSDDLQNMVDGRSITVIRVFTCLHTRRRLLSISQVSLSDSPSTSSSPSTVTRLP